MDNLVSSTRAASEKPGLKATALFVLAFIAVVIVFFLTDIFASIPASRREGVSVGTTAVDPKLEEELKKAIDFEGFKVPADVKDPFTDRGGISDAANAAGIGGSGAASVAQPGAQPGTIPGSQPPESKAPDPISATRDRYLSRDAALRRGESVATLESVFSIEDLVPIGYVGGGSTGERIIFFSRGMCQTFTFPVGTRFVDGWLRLRLGPSVQFVRDDAKRSVKYVNTATLKPVCEPKKDDKKKDEASR